MKWLRGNMKWFGEEVRNYLEKKYGMVWRRDTIESIWFLIYLALYLGCIFIIENGTNSLDAPNSHRIDTQLVQAVRATIFYIKSASHLKIVMAASFHHICEYESRILTYFWKEKHRLTWIRIKNQVNAPSYRLEIQTPSNVHPSFLIPSWCLILLLKNLLASHFLVRILEK